MEVSALEESGAVAFALADRPLFHSPEGFEESGEFAAVADEPEPADHTGQRLVGRDYRGQTLPILVNP